jgi:hypothetical protein
MSIEPMWERRHGHPALRWHERLWSLARTAAVVAIGLLVVFLATLLVPGDYFDQLESVLPKTIQEFVHQRNRESSVAGAAASLAARSSVFSIGATRAEVTAIQGQPTAASEKVWYYGASRIVFENGRVVGWVDSPANPLRVSRFAVGANAPVRAGVPASAPANHP